MTCAKDCLHHQPLDSEVAVSTIDLLGACEVLQICGTSSDRLYHKSASLMRVSSLKTAFRTIFTLLIAGSSDHPRCYDVTLHFNFANLVRFLDQILYLRA